MNARLRWLTVLFPPLLAACGHHAQTMRLQEELFDDLGRGDLARAAAAERHLTDLAAKDHAPGAPETFAVRARIASSYGYWRYTAKAVETVSVALADSDSVHGANSGPGIALRYTLAWILVDARRYDDAAEAADAIAALCASRAPGDLACRGASGLGLDDLYFATGRPREAGAELLRRNASGLLRDDRRAAWSALAVLGRWYAAFGFDPEARWYLRRCVEDSRSRFEHTSAERRAWSDPSGDVRLDVLDAAHAFDSQAPRCLEQLAEMEARTGEASGAAALAAWQARLWSEGPDIERDLLEREEQTSSTSRDECLAAHDRNTLAWYYRGKGRRLDAIAAWQDAAQSMERCSAAYGRPRSGGAAARHVDILLGLGAALEQEGRLNEAREAYSRASAIADSELHPGHAWRLDAMAGLARVRLRERNTNEAKASWRRYLDIAVQQRDPDHIDHARGLEGLAAALAESGQRLASFDLLRRASRIRAAYAKRMDSVRDLPLPPALLSPPTPAN